MVLEDRSLDPKVLMAQGMAQGMNGLPENYLKGIELFNAGSFYECHEVLEEIWLRAEGTEREFLHALIQAAAALHHDQRGNLKGAEGVFTRAKRNFDSLPRIVMKLDIPGFVCLLEDYLAGTRRSGSIVNPPIIQLTDKNHD